MYGHAHTLRYVQAIYVLFIQKDEKNESSKFQQLQLYVMNRRNGITFIFQNLSLKGKNNV
ncbi:conserved hypothetical protein [Bacillus pumilus]